MSNRHSALPLASDRLISVANFQRMKRIQPQPQSEDCLIQRTIQVMSSSRQSSAQQQKLLAERVPERVQEEYLHSSRSFLEERASHREEKEYLHSRSCTLAEEKIARAIPTALAHISRHQKHDAPIANAQAHQKSVSRAPFNETM